MFAGDSVVTVINSEVKEGSLNINSKTTAIYVSRTLEEAKEVRSSLFPTR
jgi:hypothetical protein